MIKGIWVRIAVKSHLAVPVRRPTYPREGRVRKTSVNMGLMDLISRAPKPPSDLVVRSRCHAAVIGARSEHQQQQELSQSQSPNSSTTRTCTAGG